MRIFVRFLMACGLLFSSVVFAMTEGTVTPVSSAVEAKKQVRKLKKQFEVFSEKITVNGGRCDSGLLSGEDWVCLSEDLDYQRDYIRNVRECMSVYQSSSHSDVIEKAGFVLDQMDQKLGEIEKNIENLYSSDSSKVQLGIARINLSCLEIESTFKRLFAVLSGKTTTVSQERSGLGRIVTKFREEPLKLVTALFTSFSKQEEFSGRNGNSSDNGSIDRMVRAAQSGRRVYGSLLKQCGTVDDSLNDLECHLHFKEGDAQLQKNRFTQLLKELGDCCLKIGPVSRCMQDAKLNANDLKAMLTLIKCNRYLPAGTLAVKGAEALVSHDWGFKFLSLFTKEKNCEKLKRAVAKNRPSSGFVSEATKIVETYKLHPLLDTFQAIVDKYPQYAGSIITIFKNLVEYENDLTKIGNYLKEAACYFEQISTENIDEELKKYLSTIARGWEYDSDKDWDSDFDKEEDYLSDLGLEYYPISKDWKGKEVVDKKEQDDSVVVREEQIAPGNEAEFSDFSESDGNSSGSDEGEDNNDEELQGGQEAAAESSAVVAEELGRGSGPEVQGNLASSLTTQKSTGLFTRVKDCCNRIFNSFGRVLTSAGNQVTGRLSSIFGSVSDAVTKGVSVLVSPFKSLKFW